MQLKELDFVCNNSPAKYTPKACQTEMRNKQ